MTAHVESSIIGPRAMKILWIYETNLNPPGQYDSKDHLLRIIGDGDHNRRNAQTDRVPQRDSNLLIQIFIFVPLVAENRNLMEEI